MEAALDRTPPEQDDARSKQVAALTEEVKRNDLYWKDEFDRMRRARAFARGAQWEHKRPNYLSESEPYIANITLRHLKQRTAAIYARNPKIIHRPRRRRWFQVWDGDPAKLQAAMTRVSAAQSGDPMMMAEVGPASANDMAIMQEWQEVSAQRDQIKAIGETLTILTSYYLGEQARPHKTMMKRMVLRAHEIGLAYVRPNFQRETGLRASDARDLSDYQERLARIERISADRADDEIEEDDPEVAELQAMIAELQRKPEVLLREGLTFDYPCPTTVIPDQNLTCILTFEGCDRVAQKYLMPPDRVQEVYGIDVKQKYTAQKDVRLYSDDKTAKHKTDLAAVYEIFDKPAGLVYTICDGWPDFLVEPSEPDVYIERFWPWFAYAPNWDDDEENPFPVSDVELIAHQQREINRSGESLRDHRYAARPRYGTTQAISEETKAKLETAPAHSVSSMDIPPERKLSDVFDAFPTTGIDPNLYTTAPALEDVQRIVGSQEANLGSISSGTATEVAIAEDSRQSALTSSRDELDDLLTHLAQASGQILMLNMDVSSVTEIVGPAAAWPDADREAVAKEINLEVEAGSTGRPNQAQQIQTRERIYPLLQATPGISGNKMARDLINVLDDNTDPDDWVDPGSPSILAQNGMAQAQANGASNAPAAPEREGTPGPPR